MSRWGATLYATRPWFIRILVAVSNLLADVLPMNRVPNCFILIVIDGLSVRGMKWVLFNSPIGLARYRNLVRQAVPSTKPHE